MDTGWFSSINIVTVTSILCIAPESLLSQDCTYLYTEQPPSDIDCNPYVLFRTNVVLQLQCAVTVPVGSDMTINWYHNNSVATNQRELPLETNLLSGTDTFRSVLSLSDPQPETDSGEYHCQASVGDEKLLPSESFVLSSDRFEYLSERECINVGTYFTTATKCADITASEPTTPVGAINPATTPATRRMTTLSQEMTTNQPLIVTVSTPEPAGTVATTDYTSNTQADCSVQVTPAMTTDHTSNTQPDVNVHIRIYILAGIVAVFAVIIPFLATCVCLYLWKRKPLKHTLSGNIMSEDATNVETSNDRFEEAREIQQLSGISTSDNPAYGNTHIVSDDYYVNEGMGGLAEIKTTQCEAYGPLASRDSLTAHSSISDYYVNEGMGGPSTEPARDTVTEDSEYYVNEGLGGLLEKSITMASLKQSSLRD